MCKENTDQWRESRAQPAETGEANERKVASDYSVLTVEIKEAP